MNEVPTSTSLDFKALAQNGFSGLMLAAAFFIYEAYQGFSEILESNNALLETNQVLLQRLVERGEKIDRMKGNQ